MMIMKLRSLAITAVSLLSATATFAAPTVSHSTKSRVFTPVQKTAIEKIVHQYLVQHPEVLVEASQALQAKQVQAQQGKAMQAISANKEALFNDPNTPTAGNPNGNVYVVEFFDYQCGHCRTVFPVIESIMAKDKNVKFFFKELPIFGGASKYAAKAALASNKYGKYLAFHDKLFSAKNMLDEDKVKQLAQQSGLDVKKLTAEMQDPKYEAAIRANFALAQKLGIMGTPAFVVSNKAETKFQFIPGATDEQGLQAAIQAVQK
jgi:protein-disulfide isomerase